MRCAHMLSAMSGLLALLVAGVAAAAPSLPSIIGNGMVLQRDKPIAIRGWAEPGENIRVALADAEQATTADKSGTWRVTLPAMPAGGPHVMTVQGDSGGTLRVNDILIGEVWVCAGQSNMNWPMKNGSTTDDLVAADYADIRLFAVPTRIDYLPQDSILPAHWNACTPVTLPSFSAVAFYFGKELRDKLQVPVGLVQSSWSGTKIEAWTPLRGFGAVPALKGIYDGVQRYREQYLGSLPGYVAELRKWMNESEAAMGENRYPPPMPENPVLLHQNAHATSIYNAMIRPLVDYPIRGAIWYQGESNASDGMLYYDKMKALIAGWREAWGQGDFPFYYVQIPPCMVFYPRELPLAELWEAQTACLNIPNTGMAIISDIVDVRNLHPPNKKDVGRRLALWALAKTYGREVGDYSGPLFKAVKFEGRAAVVEFSHAESGLASRDGKPLTNFELAGPDMRFVQAQADIRSNGVVVTSDNVKEAVAVRFAWGNTAQPNLMNRGGLPAGPFRGQRE